MSIPESIAVYGDPIRFHCCKFVQYLTNAMAKQKHVVAFCLQLRTASYAWLNEPLQQYVQCGP